MSRHAVRRRTAVRLCALAMSGLAAGVAGCHHQPQAAYQPPPPVLARPATSVAKRTPGAAPVPAIAALPSPDMAEAHGKPTFVETGLASWYGPNYHHHAAADGSTYDQNGMTAAHRTLPLGTTVRVTNVATGEQAYVKITDRGPFAPGRVLDLSMGAAKAISVYRAGIVKVRVEAFAHATADPAGRWAVQTGAFQTEQDALDLKSALGTRYKGARVSEFHGPTGFWVRVDPALHDKTTALAMLDWIGAPDAQALPYLVRID